MAKKSRTKKTKVSAGVQRVLDSSHSKSLLYAVVTAIVMATGVVLVLYLSRTSTHLGKVIDLKSRSVETLEQNAATAEQLQSSLLNLDATPINGFDPSVLILDALPSVYDAPALNTTIYRMAERNDIQITSLQSQDQVTTAPVSSSAPAPLIIPVTIAGDAPYDKVISLLDELQNSIRPFLVTSVALTGNNEGSDVNFNIKIQTYYQPKHQIEYRTESVEQ